MAKFEITTQQNGEFRFTLKASNGDTILRSESYKSKDGCKNGIESVRKNAYDPARYHILESRDGRHYFNLVAGNNQVIGTGELYQTMADMNRGIASVQKDAADARIVDLTLSEVMA